jgi:hypothetical protein
MKTKIQSEASKIAGALWDDREMVGTLAEQLVGVASSPARGTDGDLADDDRRALRALAQTAKELGL